MRGKRLEKKIICALCLGVSFTVPSVFAADITLEQQVKSASQQNVLSGYEITGDDIVNIPSGIISATLDNTNWLNPNSHATIFGFVNGNHTVTLKGATDFTITGIATGGNSISPSTNALAFANASGLYNYGDSIVNGNTTIDGNIKIIESAAGGRAEAASADAKAYALTDGINNSNSSSNITINGASTIITTAEGGTAIGGSARAHAVSQGIRNTGSTKIVGDTTIEAAATGGNATDTGTVPGSAYHIFADSVASGIRNTGGSTTITGNAVITAEAIGGITTSIPTNTKVQEYAFADAAGIYNTGGNTIINGDTTITAKAKGGSTSYTPDSIAYAVSYGIYNEAGSTTINGNTTITATASGGKADFADANAFALDANGGKIDINQSSGKSYTVRLIGDVMTDFGATIKLTLNNTDSFLRGNVCTGKINTNAIDFTVNNGAVWQPVYDNRNGTFNSDRISDTTGTYVVNTTNSISGLTLANGGIIDLTWDDAARASARSLNIGTLNGNGGILKINTDVANHTGDRINVALVGGPTTLQVGINFDPVMLKGNTFSGGVPGYSPVTVANGGNNVTLEGIASENGAYYLLPTFSGNNLTNIEIDASSNTKAAASAARGQALLMQADMNHLKKRLGDLRDEPETKAGIWARISNGEIASHKYSKVESNYKVLQIGYDTSKQVQDGRKYIGGAYNYLTADNSFYRGSGDSKNYNAALYQTWIGSDGHYYDIIAKRGRQDNKYHVTDLSNTYATADYKTWTDSISAEYGYRKQLTNNCYVEPQLELTFGHIEGVNYTTSSGMNIEQDSINRLIGRMGISAGKKLSNGNHIYSTFSMLHDFCGEANIRADSLTYNQGLDETWYEFILGATAKLSNHSNGYINVEKLFGGNVSSNWQVNAGCRFSF